MVFERLPVDVPVPQVPVGLVLDVPDGVGHDGAGDWALAWIFSLDGDPLLHHGDLKLAENLKERRLSMFDLMSEDQCVYSLKSPLKTFTRVT